MPAAVSPALHFEIATGTSPLACVPPSSFRTFSINAEQYLASADWPNAANGNASAAQATRKAVVVRAFILLSHLELKIPEPRVRTPRGPFSREIPRAKPSKP